MKFYEDKTYLKMCEKAEEIQKINPQHSNNNYVVSVGRFKVRDHIFKKGDFVCFGTLDNYRGSGVIEGLIWLPKQDQLQEISGLEWFKFDEACKGYIEFVFDVEKGETVDGRLHNTYSKEICGLMAIMKSNYHKTWIGEEWV